MKNPNSPAFSPDGGEYGGLSKIEYVFIEILKSSITPGKIYTDVQMDAILQTANTFTKKVFSNKSDNLSNEENHYQRL